MKDLPRGPGVYRFYGENDVLLYVGKSTNIAQRVASHFSGDHNTSRGVRISESLRRVECTETAGELGIAFHELRLRTWPWKGLVAIVERRENQMQPDILVVYNWMHVATLHDEQELHGLSLRGQSVTFDLDSYKLLVKALLGRSDKAHPVIELPAVGEPDVLMP